MFKIFKSYLKSTFIIVILVMISLMILTRPFLSNYKLLSVVSGSMSPTIKVGDMIIISTTTDYKRYDIITFTNADNIITHRIMEIKLEDNERKFITKGDANKTIDEYSIKNTQVLGKVIFTIPQLGYIIKFTRSTIGLIFILSIPLSVFLSYLVKTYLLNKT